LAGENSLKFSRTRIGCNQHKPFLLPSILFCCCKFAHYSFLNKLFYNIVHDTIGFSFRQSCSVTLKVC